MYYKDLLSVCALSKSFTIYVSAEEFIPSEWNGNYTCQDDNTMIQYKMNITKSSSSIGTVGAVFINGSTFDVTGSFASFYKTFTLQSSDLILDEIHGRNFTKVELDGSLLSAVFIKGVLIFRLDNGMDYRCDTELHRNIGKSNIVLTFFLDLC